MVSITWLDDLKTELEKLSDYGRYSLSIREAQAMCKSGKVCEELQEKFPCEDTAFDLCGILEDNFTIKYHINKGFQEKAEIDKKSDDELDKETGLELLVSYAEQLLYEKGTDDE